MLAGVDLDIRQGETLAVVGASGVGKLPCCTSWEPWNAPAPARCTGRAKTSSRWMTGSGGLSQSQGWVCISISPFAGRIQCPGKCDDAGSHCPSSSTGRPGAGRGDSGPGRAERALDPPLSPTCPAASSSGWQWPGPWCCNQKCSWPMNPPATWIRSGGRVQELILDLAEQRRRESAQLRIAGGQAFQGRVCGFACAGFRAVRKAQQPAHVVFVSRGGRRDPLDQKGLPFRAVFFRVGPHQAGDRLRKGRLLRPSTLQDVREGCAVMDATPEIDLMWTFATANDVPVEQRQLHEYHAYLTSTSKPLVLVDCPTDSTPGAHHGRARRRPRGLPAAAPPRPALRGPRPPGGERGAHGRHLRVRAAGRADLGVHHAHGRRDEPVTLAGTLALMWAEMLGMVTVDPDGRPGAAILACCGPGILDMRAASMSLGQRREHPAGRRLGGDRPPPRTAGAQLGAVERRQAPRGSGRLREGAEGADGRSGGRRPHRRRVRRAGLIQRVAPADGPHRRGDRRAWCARLAGETRSTRRRS